MTEATVAAGRAIVDDHDSRSSAKTMWKSHASMWIWRFGCRCRTANRDHDAALCADNGVVERPRRQSPACLGAIDL
jgi:hypothetical protein